MAVLAKRIQEENKGNYRHQERVNLSLTPISLFVCFFIFIIRSFLIVIIIVMTVLFSWDSWYNFSFFFFFYYLKNLQSSRNKKKQWKTENFRTIHSVSVRIFGTRNYYYLFRLSTLLCPKNSCWSWYIPTGVKNLFPDESVLPFVFCCCFFSTTLFALLEVINVFIGKPTIYIASQHL